MSWLFGLNKGDQIPTEAPQVDIVNEIFLKIIK